MQIFACGTPSEKFRCCQASGEFPVVVTDFVEVVKIEALDRISIWCRAGHHRSVLIAECLELMYSKASLVRLRLHFEADSRRCALSRMRSVEETGLFVYGSLLHPKLLRDVLQTSVQTWTAREATLRGFSRKRVRDKLYPAVVPEASGRVDGLLLRGLSLDQMRLLDAYEGEDYYRQEVSVELVESGQDVRAAVYVWNSSLDFLDSEEWDALSFEYKGIDSI